MKRSPAAAFWLSLLPGLGHLYLGQTIKGLAFALIAVGLIDVVDHGADAFGIMIPIFWIFSMLDAHRTAQAMNRGLESAADPWGNLGASSSKWWGGILIGLGVLFLLQNLDLFDFDWIWRFWPLALIGLGIWLIRAPRAPVEPASPLPPAAVNEPLADQAGIGEPNAPQEQSSIEGAENERAEAG